MEGLKAGRIVYYVFTQQDAERIAQSRLDSAGRPGVYAHIGNRVRGGDISPGMVTLAVDDDNRINIKVALDGNDTYWVQSVPYDDSKAGGSWHWMFDGQSKRYDPTKTTDTAQPEQSNR